MNKTLIYLSGDLRASTYVPYAVGDLVNHKVNGVSGVVARIYAKLNRAVVELETGARAEFTATSLVPAPTPFDDTELLNWVLAQGNTLRWSERATDPQIRYRVQGSHATGDGATPRLALTNAIKYERANRPPN